VGDYTHIVGSRNSWLVCRLQNIALDFPQNKTKVLIYRRKRIQMTPPNKENNIVSKHCEQHAKVEYQLETLAKIQEKQSADIKECKQKTEAAMGSIKEEIQKLRDDFADGKRNPKILIAIIGLVGIAMSTAGSICGVLITVYFKLGAP
jgi:hypothetical protein